MDLEERPLLHFPDLVLALLRASLDQAGTIAAAASLLARDRMRVQDQSVIDSAELATRLGRARHHLEAAHLVEMLDAHSFRITPRGRTMLLQHRDGIDDSVLMDFPEFRAWLKQVAAHAPPEDARAGEFQRGWLANQEGAGLGDNPYATDTAQHAAWKDGWLEAHHVGQE